MTTNGLNRIAIVGIGNVGVSVLESLLASKAFDKPVVLSRDPSANKNLEPFTKVTTIVQVDPEDTAAVVKTLQEHNIQALVATTGGANGPAQQPLLDASKQAQIQLFVSAEFGVDFRDIPDADLHPWILARKQFHTTLDESGVPWISLATGLFAEFVVSEEIGFDPSKKTAKLVGDGKQAFGSTSLKDIGRATVLALQQPLPSIGKGKVYAIQGIDVPLSEWVSEVQKQNGQWQVEWTSYDEAKKHQTQDDEEGFALFLRASIADGRLLVPASKVDNKVLGFEPQVSLAAAIKAAL